MSAQNIDQGVSVWGDCFHIKTDMKFLEKIEPGKLRPYFNRLRSLTAASFFKK